MRLIDVNVLVYAFREDAPDHDRYRTWLHDVVNSDEAFAVSDPILASFLRVVTHRAVFSPATPLPAALRFANTLRSQLNAVPIGPGARHWDIFTRLCETVSARGNLIPDAFNAALAIESGCEFVTTDGDYARFPGLRWRHPLR